ncbi:Casein kinase I-like protein 3 [Diplonema papillatum]|nr:Casein kinase I-like protein 3 [Diplonema papillatum]
MVTKKKRTCISWSGEILGNYEVGACVGSGTFADVFEARNRIKDPSVRYCLKVETRAREKLAAEYATLKTLSGSLYLPTCYEFFPQGSANVLVLDLMGPSLDAIIKKGCGTLSPGTVSTIAVNIMSCMQFIHDRGFLHRDIKPHNFVLGRKGGWDRIYIIDFGLAHRFVTSTGDHIPFTTGKSFVGTERYVSVGAHKGFEQGRRDDMESLAYMFLYFLRGRLPWQNIGARFEKPERNHRTMLCKQVTSLDELCGAFPPAFRSYLASVRKLKFESRPDYEKYRSLFLPLREQRPLDWELNGLAQRLSDDLESRSFAEYAKSSNNSNSPMSPLSTPSNELVSAPEEFVKPVSSERDTC